jgi:cobalamin biosynthesis Mg chelatase CobN
MTGWKATAAMLLATVGLLVAGLGVSAALADPGHRNGPPQTVPGSPGDDCSHGNSDKDCRPDPNEHGKDCDDHGNARGNEDHCTSVDTPTTTTTTSSTTTTNSTTTTAKTTTTTSSSTTTTTTSTPTTTTTQGTTNSTPPGTPGSPSGNGPPSGGSEVAGESASTPPTGAPEVQQGPQHQVEGAQRTVSRVHAIAKQGKLPFTGFPAWVLALIGSALLAGGLGLRRLA